MCECSALELYFLSVRYVTRIQNDEVALIEHNVCKDGRRVTILISVLRKRIMKKLSSLNILKM